MIDFLFPHTIFQCFVSCSLAVPKLLRLRSFPYFFQISLRFDSFRSNLFFFFQERRNPFVMEADSETAEASSSIVVCQSV